MKNLVSSKRLQSVQQKELALQSELKRKVDRTINELILQFDQSQDNNEQLSILNRMDEIISAEIFYWSNVLNDLPTDCPPCMATRGEEAKRHILELTPVINDINALRVELLAD